MYKNGQIKQLAVIGVLCLLVLSCKENEEGPKEWVTQSTLKIDGVNPIGIALLNDSLWLSDGDHNRLVQIDAQGKITKTIDDLDRPMHIDSDDTMLYVPQYGMDNIAVFNNGERNVLTIKDSLDAPAGVSVFGKEKAIADFYNNRILYFNGEEWISFGKEGKAKGYFYYPTDVQITTNEIWVADAYNNRIQVFDKQGKFIKMIGHEEKMNAATGIYVSDDSVFITDFENDRVLIFDLDGKLKQKLSEGIKKPTDIIIRDDKLYVINYRTGVLNIYTSETVKKDSSL